MYMCDYLPYYQQCERYRYTDMFFLIVIHVILLCPPRVWFFSPGHARSSTSWNEHYCLSCLKYRSLKAESYFSFHYISHNTYYTYLLFIIGMNSDRNILLQPKKPVVNLSFNMVYILQIIKSISLTEIFPLI
jgi:hypothetical protein